MNTSNDKTEETVAGRLDRLSISPQSEKRMESLTVAAAAGVDDATFSKIANAMRVKRNSETIVLPSHRYEHLSRGRGWARQGKGAKVVFADSVDGGYECGPGRWSVGATDGFSRKDATEWTVSNVQVGERTWTIAS
jgi:hypothetical protein